jgi:hypothetical protein
MGLYDEVFSDYPLPAPAGLPDRLLEQLTRENLERGLQTKDLDCGLERYAITAAGRLVRMQHVRTTPPDWFNSTTGHDTASPDPEPETKPLQIVDVDFHGRLHIHSLLFADDAGTTEVDGVRIRVIGPDFDGEAYSINYTVKFTDGVVVAIEDATATPLRRR